MERVRCSPCENALQAILKRFCKLLLKRTHGLFRKRFYGACKRPIPFEAEPSRHLPAEKLQKLQREFVHRIGGIAHGRLWRSAEVSLTQLQTFFKPNKKTAAGVFSVFKVIRLEGFSGFRFKNPFA